MDFLPLSGLLKSEMAESDAEFFVPNGITTEMVNSNHEMTDQLFRQYLEECISHNQLNKVWVYYILSTWYYAEGKFEKIITLSLRASAEHPSDPRAYYFLGSIYYGFFINSTADPKYSNEALLARPDFSNWPREMRELVRENLEFERHNQRIVNAMCEFKPTLTPEEAAKLALQYFGCILKCNISSRDRQIVQTHITSITQAQLNLKQRKVNTPQGLAQKLRICLRDLGEDTVFVQEDGAVHIRGQDIFINVADNGFLDIKINVFTISWIQYLVLECLKNNATNGGKITYFTQFGTQYQISEVKDL